MGGWVSGWVEECMQDGQMDEYVDGWMDEYMDVWMGGWIDKWMVE